MGTATGPSPPNLQRPLTSRVALVTGGTRGIGAAISRRVVGEAGEAGNIGQANYAASKSGLFGLTKSLAKESMCMLARAGCP